jgi:signal transduction histidine kinase
MKLRQRIALVTLAATAPMVGALVWLDVRAQQTAAEAELAELVLARTELAGERERCIANGQSWDEAPRLPRRDRNARGPGPGGPPPSAANLEGRPPDARPPLAATEGDRSQPRTPAGPHRAPARFFVYDAALRPRTQGAPDLPPDAARDPAATISRSSIWHGDWVEVLVRTPWPETPCSFVLARGTTEPWLGALLPPTRIWALPALVVFAAVLLSIGPIVGRIRKLTAAVQRTAAEGYAQPVARSAAPRGWGDDEVAELARAFDSAGDKVRALLAQRDQRERALRDFVADTTHDVAIPLTVLQGHLTTLRDGLASGRALDRAALASAMDEAHYIGALLHNLGAAAKLDAEAFTPSDSEVELGALVTRVVGRHRPIAQQNEVAIEVAVPERAVVVRGDVTLLEQAVSNVVYNAVRHNRAGGHVAVVLQVGGRRGEEEIVHEDEHEDVDEHVDEHAHAHVDEHAHAHEEHDIGRRFVIRVLDDGPGVAPELLSRLAERGFRSATARSRTPEGHGLGLHITTRVVDAHGMKLSFTTPEGGGLQVEIEGRFR